MYTNDQINKAAELTEKTGNKIGAKAIRQLAEQRDYLRGVMDEINGLCRYLRQGGADHMDLQGLEEGLSFAVDMAHDALEATK